MSNLTDRINMIAKETFKVNPNMNFWIFKQTQEISLMVIVCHVITTLCFPSILIYKGLPGSRFNIYYSTEKHTHAMTWVGCINVGSFLICSAIGTFLFIKLFRPRSNGRPTQTFFMKHSYTVNTIIIILMALSCSQIM